MKQIMQSHFIQKYLQFILIIFFLALTYSLYFFFKISKDRPLIRQSENLKSAVKLVDLQEENLPIMHHFPANVTVRNFVGIVPRITGRVVFVDPHFKAGLAFEKNTVLFKIDPREFRARINSAKAQLKKAKATQRLIQAEADISVHEWNMINPDQSVPDLVLKKPELSQAKADILVAQSALEQAQLDLSYTNFALPFDGTIESNMIEIGSFVSAGQSYGRIYQKQSLEIRLQISQEQSDYINAQDYKAQINIDDKIYPAHIERILSVLDQETRLVDVIIKPDHAAETPLRSGMFIDVTLLSKRPQHLYRISEDMLEDGKLRILSKDNIISFKSVEILGRYKDTLYIPSMGKDIRIIQGSSLGLGDGSKVNL